MGGVSIILFGMIAAVGLRTLVENQVDFKNSRNLMIVAVMLVLGLGGAALNFSFTYDGIPNENRVFRAPRWLRWWVLS